MAHAPKTTPLWQAIARTLRDEIAQGQYRRGDRLPTEAEMAARFGVNRHTVRHALTALSEDGLVLSRRGAGTFVEGRPTRYPIGGRVRFHENLLAEGRHPDKRVLGIERRAATTQEARVLKVGPGDPLCVCRGVSLADGQPIALYESLYPEARLPGIATALVQHSSVTEALRRCGVTDHRRVSTRLTAVAADATQALHLRVAEGAPLLRATGVNVAPDEQPVEYGLTVFAGDRVTLTVEA